MPTSSADDAPLGYAAAATAYWQAGWRGILPLPPQAKSNPPAIYCDKHRPRSQRTGTMSCPDCTHYTGHFGIEPSYPDIMAWSETFPTGNLGLRLPDGIIGIDVDDYNAKTGAATFAEAIRRWGPLPSAPRSTSREGNRISGIRIFRVPPGTQLETRIAFPDLGIGDIEIVQRHHRYAVAWPSIHPEGRPYWWRNDDDQFLGIPEPDGLPWLPQKWIDALRVQPRTPGDATTDVALTLTDGEPSMRVKLRLGTAVSELSMPGTSRHDTCTRHVMALTRLGKSGEPGVKQALQVLCNVLIAARQVDKSDTPEGTRLEFQRMLTNDNLARELATPSVTDWVQDLVVDETPPVPESGGELSSAAPDQRPIESSPAPPDSDSSAVSSPGAPELDGAAANDANAPGDNEGRTDQPTRPRSPLEDIEQGFWESRESLNQIYTTALAMMASPWAVLGICVARALTTVRPVVTLPPLIGGPGSLNWFCALVARSGGGKGAANAASNLLIPDTLITEKNLGSGEGLVALFGRSADPDDPTPVNEALLINVDEVGTLTALGQRSGSTTMSVIKSAFSGESLGFSYADKTKRRNIQRHTYRMTMVLSVQPRRSADLFADEAGGTPQRFMWFPAKDVRISMDEIWPTGPLALPSPSEWLYNREVRIPAEARHAIRYNRMLDARDQTEALDGHALFCREKFAYGLAVLDGRVEMTLEDWQLSGIAAEISDYARQMCLDQLREASRIDALDRGEIRGIENSAADDAKEFENAERLRSVLRWALDKITEAGADGIPQRELSQKRSGRDRRWLPAALQIGVSNGLIRQVEGTTTWVKI